MIVRSFAPCNASVSSRWCSRWRDCRAKSLGGLHCSLSAWSASGGLWEGTCVRMLLLVREHKRDLWLRNIWHRRPPEFFRTKNTEDHWCLLSCVVCTYTIWLLFEEVGTRKREIPERSWQTVREFTVVQSIEFHWYFSYRIFVRISEYSCEIFHWNSVPTRRNSVLTHENSILSLEQHCGMKRRRCHYTW